VPTRGDRVKRRQFITLLGGAAAASSVSWPLAARAQQGERVRRIGVLMSVAEGNSEGQSWVPGFVQRLDPLSALWEAGHTEYNGLIV
jgi:hypothetical protein